MLTLKVSGRMNKSCNLSLLSDGQYACGLYGVTAKAKWLGDVYRVEFLYQDNLVGFLWPKRITTK